LLYEGAYFFDVTNPDDIDYRGTMLTGSLPEADAPYRLAIFEPYVITVNNLSYTCTIYNLLEENVEAIIDLGEACYDVVVVQGTYVVCGGYNNNTVKIIDLGNFSIIKEVTTGQRPMELEAHPTENIVYAANIKSNSISVIEVDGVNSQVVATIPCGIIGVYIPFFGIRSGVEITPSGDYLLVAASFDDEVKVIDTESNAIVKSLTVGDFPLSIAYNLDESIACVTNLFDDSFSLISVDGADSEVLGTYDAFGDYPVYVDYCASEDEFWLCNYNSENVVEVDPQTGSYLGQQSFSAYGGVWNLRFHEGRQEPVYLTVGNDNIGPSIIYQDSVFELPASASHIELGHMHPSDYAVATIPGPDYFSAIHLDLIGKIDLPLSSPLNSLTIKPNPCEDSFTISLDAVIRECRIRDVKGNIISMMKVDSKSIRINTSDWFSGVYFIDIISEDGIRYSGKLLRR
jgi:YVTN family beta-propeller protein